MAYRSSLYPGICRECSAPYAVGDRVWFLGRGKGCKCETCAERRPARTDPAISSTIDGVRASNREMETRYLPANTGEGGHVVREWSSMAAYIDTGEQMPDLGEKSRPGTIEFQGDGHWSETMKVARRGYVEARPVVEVMSENMRAKIAPTLRPAFRSFFDVTGGQVDVGRFLAGEPENMIETELIEIARPGKVVTVLIHGGMLSKVKTRDFVARGVAIVALIEALEQMQHSTEVWLEITSSRDGDPEVYGTSRPVLTHLVKLKDAADVLDIDDLMFAVAYPGRHRRLTFSIRQLEPDHKRFGIGRDGAGEQGVTIPLTCRDRVGADICLESLSSTGDPVVVDAESWIATQLEAIGLGRIEA